MRLPTHKTKIVCTIGPASRSEAVLEQLIFQGMNVARLNFAHGTVETVEMIAKIATSAERERKSVQALADLPAYFRTGAGSDSVRVEDVFSLNTVESAWHFRLAGTGKKAAGTLVCVHFLWSLWITCGFMMIGISVIDNTGGEARVFQGIINRGKIMKSSTEDKAKGKMHQAFCRCL